MSFNVALKTSKLVLHVTCTQMMELVSRLFIKKSITLDLGTVFSHVSYMIHDTTLLKWPTLLSVQQHFSNCLQFYCKLRLQFQLFLGICLSMTEMQGESVSPMAEDSKRVSLPASVQGRLSHFSQTLAWVIITIG